MLKWLLSALLCVTLLLLWWMRDGEQSDPDREPLRALEPIEVETAPPENRQKVPRPVVQVTGRVIDGDTGEPVASARLFLGELDEPFEPLSVALDPEGRFRFTMARNRLVRLVAIDSERWSYRNPNDVQLLRPDSEIGDIGPLTLRLYRTVPVNLEIRDRFTQEPIAGARVRDRNGLATPVRTSEDGLATLQLTPGFHTARISAEGYAPTEIALEITPHENRHRVALEPAGVCVVVVRDRREGPLDGVRVLYRQAGRDGSGVTDANGTFAIEGLRKHVPFAIRLEATGYHPFDLVDLLLPAEGARNLALVMKPLGSEDRAVSGVVISEDGAPLESVSIASSADPSLETFSDEEGRFEIPHLEIPVEGRSGLFFRKRDLASRFVSLDPDSPVDLVLRVVMNEGRRSEISVVDEDDRPIAGARVRARWSEMGMLLESEDAITDDRGWVAFDRVRGSLSARADTPGYYPNEKTFSSVEQAILTLESERWVNVFVHASETVQPIREIEIAPVDGGEHEVPKSMHSPDGHFRLPAGPESDPIRWVIRAEGYAPAILEPSGLESVEIALDPKGPVFDVVIEGVPETGAAATAYLTELGTTFDWERFWKGLPPEGTLQTHRRSLDATSRFTISPLPQDTTVHLVVDAPGRAWGHFIPGFKVYPEGTPPDRRTPTRISTLPEATVSGAVEPSMYGGAASLLLSQETEPRFRARVALETDHSFFFGKCPPGRYRLTLLDSAGRQLASRGLELMAGEAVRVAFGQHEIPILLEVGGQPRADATVLLSDQSSAGYRIAISDGSGFLHLADPEPERELTAVFAGHRLDQPEEAPFLLRVHPNRVRFLPGQDQVVSFEQLAKVTGRAATETVSWELYLIGKTDAGATYYRRTTPWVDGRFRFSEIPPGDYQISRSEAGHPPEILVPRLRVDYEDIDLGDLVSEPRGTLRIDLASFPDASCMFRVAVFGTDSGGRPEGQPLDELAFPEVPREIVFEAIPAGDIAVSYNTGICPSALDSSVQNALVLPDKVTTIAPRPLATTELMVRLDTPPQSITMAHSASGTLVPFHPGDSVRDPAMGEALILDGVARAKGFPEGAWTLSLVRANGETTQRKIALTRGIRTHVDLR